MPEMTKDDIRDAIDKNGILGIAIDTAVFDKYGCNLQFPVLASLEQFKGRSTRLIISEIVQNEMTAHIAREAAATQEKLRVALNEHRKQWRLPQGFADGAKLSIDVDADDHAEQQVKTFIETGFWRESFERRRCLVPASAFCEPDGNVKPQTSARAGD